MKRLQLSLSQKLAGVFAALLLACCGASAWLQVRANAMHETEVVQDISRGLAAYIGRTALREDQSELEPAALRRLFGQLMVVNPSVEVYLLDDQGRIRGHDAPEGHLIRDRVDLAPIRKLIDGGALPIFGDDPRSASARKVFSAAPLRQGGYIYVVLQGEAHDKLAAQASRTAVMRTTLWSMALVTTLGLAAGLAAFALITRPLRRLTVKISQFDSTGGHAVRTERPPAPAARDEITALETAFSQMASRIDAQWRELAQQDQERRDMVANISHDLRTPLTSLHGYLEALSLKADVLSREERQRYLDIALAQSAKVGGLAQALFELARLEHGMVQATPEAFSMVDLAQDVLEKFALPAEAKQLHLRAGVPPMLPAVRADLGMIERVLTNLLDNAIRHTPAGGTVEVDLAAEDGKVAVTVSDSGPGIPAALRESIFNRPFPSGGAHRGGGLGLLIVQRMLQLNGSQIRLVDTPVGATLRFALPVSR
ncbi:MULTISPECIES: sensor histidine kinase [Cupriavidus]|uniref:histidine kinase n=1 Tax=Cupriavidus pauculus TaxID=82633 RepID=A0A5P2HAS4_9BURK|nr:HAMP domain-containing sensor histidine kinase [Cupriavidus pauculus]QET04359.1 HAMP domain-containing histidine kinase [Cupriavidus pauculus]